MNNIEILETIKKLGAAREILESCEEKLIPFIKKYMVEVLKWRREPNRYGIDDISGSKNSIEFSYDSDGKEYYSIPIEYFTNPAEYLNKVKEKEENDKKLQAEFKEASRIKQERDLYLTLKAKYESEFK